MMMSMLVSLGGQPLANLCLRDYDKVHSPKSPRGDRCNGPETLAKRSSIELKGEEVSWASKARDPSLNPDVALKIFIDKDLCFTILMQP